MRRIYVVDPDPAFIEFLQMTLEGYSVSGSGNGLAALHELKEGPPDLVITELKLPDISGVDLVESLLGNPLTSEVRVLVCSAAILETRRFRGHLARLKVPVVEKPFELEVLCGWVDHLLSDQPYCDSGIA